MYCIYIHTYHVLTSRYLSWAKTAGWMKVNEIFVCCFLDPGCFDDW